MSKKSKVLDRHYVMLGLLQASKGASRLHTARQMMDIADDVAAEWRRVYPGNPLPAHPGFSAAAIELERLGEFAEAIAVCERARDMGWAPKHSMPDEFNRRIARYRTKAVRATTTPEPS